MKGMVVAPEPLAVDAGLSILKKGGNAVDAAIAGAFAQGVVNPMLCGIGGSGLLLIHHAAFERSFLLDCSCTMGSKSIPKSWADHYRGRSEAYGRYILENEENQFGYKSIMVPGFVMGAWKAFEKYGSQQISWEELIQPAKEFALTGFQVYPYIATFWFDKGDKPGYPNFFRKIEKNEASKSIYGTPKSVGQWFIQKDYGMTLDLISENSGLDFYRGELGEVISSDMEQKDALIMKEDTMGFDVPETETITGYYRGYEIRGAVSGCSSSPQIISMLQTLEGFDMKGMGHNSPDYIDLVSRVMRAGFLDHLQLKGDPPFSIVQNLLPKFLSSERAAYWQNRIQEDPVTGPDYPTGLGSETTHISVVDEEGTGVSWTHTLGSLGGSGVVTQGLGFLYNNFVGHFNPIHGKWDSILPGKRGGGGAPLLLYKNGKLVMVIGAPGGSRIITAVLQVILNVVDHGMTMQEAVNAPRFHSEEKNRIFLEPEIPENVEQTIKAKGFDIFRSNYMSRVQAIWVNQPDGNFFAGSDPRGGGGQGVIA